MHELIGTEVSLYTGKVRSYLKYKRIPYAERLSTAEVYRETIIPRTGVRYIPVLITDDDVAIQDSTEIIDALEKRYPEPSIYPTTPRQRLAALLLELYGDEWLVLPAMHYRWQNPANRQFAVQEFGRTSAPSKSPEEQLAIGERISRPFAGALPALGITPETSEAIEKSYLSFLGEFDQHLQEYEFLLGSRPSIGDFGFVGPLYAHLYRDPFSGALMNDRAPCVARWVERMIRPRTQDGTFLKDDAVPATLTDLLRRMFREQIPTLLATLRRLRVWAEENSDLEVPRSVGEVDFLIEHAAGSRKASTYPQWMWQRSVDFYQGLGSGERDDVKSWLSEIPGAIEALETPVEVRLERRNNRLVRV